MANSNLEEIWNFAYEKLREHGLADKGWTFTYDKAKVRYGCCHFDRKQITLSRYLVVLNPQEESRDTVLHELAHAFAGRAAGHGPRWKAVCEQVGANPTRCYDSDDIVQPKPHYWATCPACGGRSGLFKTPLRVRACADCCKTHGNGRYDERFKLIITDAGTGRVVSIGGQDDDGPRNAKYVGRCPACKKEYPFYRKQNFNKACGACCKKHADGRFDERFRLKIFVRQ